MNGGLGAYDLTYEYDLGGNPTKKTNELSGQVDVYTYDIQDPATYQSNNNRLMFVESSDTTGPIATTYDYYNDVGNVERIL